MGALTIVYAFITERTVLGRRIYALGGNEKAAKLSGVKTERLTFLAFVNMGVLAAVAGLVFAARLNTATPKAGFALELDVIAAVFIGGASMSGGVGKIVGAVVGAFLMGVLNNGMSIMGIGIDYQQMIKGLVLLAAVIFDVYNKKKGLMSWRSDPPSGPAACAARNGTGASQRDVIYHRGWMKNQGYPTTCSTDARSSDPQHLVRHHALQRRTCVTWRKR
jgi:ABC-type branched-subunit amino acid transport system permease subunit